jgi:arsenate reductase-like glutaredoxin family protein
MGEKMKSKAEYEEIIKDLNKACLKLIDEKSECEKKIEKAKQETAEAILEKIKEHKNCYEYHIVNGKKNTCLDMILLWVLDEWLSREKEKK